MTASTPSPPQILVRWAINITQPGVDAELTERLVPFVQPEERARIRQFMFEKDRHRALLGRILMRTFLYRFLSGQLDDKEDVKALSSEPARPTPPPSPPALSWWDIRLTRSAHNKPEFDLQHYQQHAGSRSGRAVPSNLHFNLSHHGDWVVFTAGTVAALGIDVTDIEPPRGSETVTAYLSWMTGQFTPTEWRWIRQSPRDDDRLAQFHRYWGLKESFVKAKGVGLNLDLQRIEFHGVPAVEDYSQADTIAINKPFTDISVHLDGVPQADWYFELYHVDHRHPVAVAYSTEPTTRGRLTEAAPEFTILSLQGLLGWLPVSPSL